MPYPKCHVLETTDKGSEWFYGFGFIPSYCNNIRKHYVQKLCCDIFSTFLLTSSFQRQLSQEKGSTLAGSYICRLRQRPQWLHIKVTSVSGSCFMFKRTHVLQFNLVLISADTASHFVHILLRKTSIMQLSLDVATSCGIIKNFQPTDLYFSGPTFISILDVPW